MITKRGGVWWTRFSHAGERFQKSLGTANRQKALQLEQAVIAEANRGVLAPKLTKLSALLVRDAMPIYLADRAACFSRYGKPLAEKTKQTERERSRQVVRLLGDRFIKKITADDVNQYVKHRHGVDKVSGGSIRRELDVVRGLFKVAGTWGRIADQVRIPATGEEIGEAFSDEQVERIEKTAASRPEWKNAALAFTICTNTSLRPVELRSLQWQHIDWKEQLLYVPRSKTPTGLRRIPIDGKTRAALQELHEHAQILSGGFIPQSWYVLPGVTPTTQLGSWRKGWHAILAAAGIPQVRFYSSRHTRVTNLLSNPEVPESVALEIVGHVSPKMLKRYSHIRLDAMRKAIAAVERQADTRAGTIGVQFGGGGGNAST